MFYYIDYDGLKDALHLHRTWDEEAEQAFIRKLESELQKVYGFTQVKSEEIIRRIGASEKEVNDVVAKVDRNGGGPADDAPTDEDFELLEEDLSDIIADVHDLAKFTQLNYTGFQKIIKKHDVGTAAINYHSNISI
jgi:SPX domain protein involved in polyphosphate accumulation